MRFFVRPAWIVVLVIGLSWPIYGQDTDRLTVTVIASNPDEAPLRIVGFKLPTTFGDPPKVIVQNTTSRHVTAFLIDAVIGKSDGEDTAFPKQGEAAAIQSGTSHASWPEEREITPHGLGEARDRALGSYIVGHLAREVDSACLRVVVVVTRVEFADKSVWNLGKPAWQFWKDSLPEGVSPCPQQERMRDTLRRLEGSGPMESKGLPTQADSGRLESYSFSCSLRETKAGKLVALCPF